MAGWKIPELNAGFALENHDKWSIFQQAMFDYRRVGTADSFLFQLYPYETEVGKCPNFSHQIIRGDRLQQIQNSTSVKEISISWEVYAKAIWLWVKTSQPFCSHQNSWDSW